MCYIWQYDVLLVAIYIAKSGVSAHGFLWFCVDFPLLHRVTVESLVHGPWLQPEHFVRPVGSILKPIQSPVQTRSLAHASGHVQPC